MLSAAVAAAISVVGWFDRMLSSLRPSLATALLVFSVAGAFMLGGTGGWVVESN